MEHKVTRLLSFDEQIVIDINRYSDINEQEGKTQNMLSLTG